MKQRGKNIKEKETWLRGLLRVTDCVKKGEKIKKKEKKVGRRKGRGCSNVWEGGNKWWKKR